MKKRLVAAIHRVWRLFPRESRRRLFMHATALMAPIGGPISANLPAVVAGVLSSATGLGESARMNLDGLRHAGLPFGGVDLSGTLLGAADLPAYPLESRQSPQGPGTLILHTPGTTLPYALLRCGRDVVRGKKLVGFWHWELARLPREWRLGSDRLDEIWVPSQFCADAVRQSFAGPIRVIPHPVDVAGARRRLRTDARFKALAMFNMASGFERKNPLAAIRAFKRAFGADPSARLTLKIVNPMHYPKGMEALSREIDGAENIALLVEVMPRQTVMQLIADFDAVLSLHRSEGFGLLAAEAMLIGTPVIATDWSATSEFVSAETGIPIPYKMVPAIDPQGCSHDPRQNWADPDVEAAAAALVRLRSDPAFSASLTETASRRAGERFSVDHYASLITDALGH